MRIKLLVVGAALAVTALACTKHPPAGSASGPPDKRAPQTSVAGPAGADPGSPAQAQTQVTRTAAPQGAAPVLADDARIIGKGVALGNLVVYPVTSHAQIDVGPLLTLDEAIEAKTAEVREVDGGGSVNTLVIENKGAIPIFVLAGTVVKGGKQDRQIGQDFIIDSKSTTPVDAFCVEHGRWNAQRNGQGTGGRFRTADVVATSKVRAAGQYKKSQGEVWSKVGESNGSLGTRTASDTFVAAVDDTALAKSRAELATKIEAALAAVNPQDDVVGVGYAIDGEVRGVRWFAHHKVFAMHEKKLVNGIALEAITASAEAKAAGRAASTKPAPKEADVDKFVKDVEAQAVVETRDAAANANMYKESNDAYGSSTMMKPMGKGSAAPPKPLSKDFTKK
jgi:hypothetical protein